MEKIDKIFIKGAKENNLKNIDLAIPKNKLVVITGVSGSGKSSLAFDTIYAEGYRRYMENLSSSARFFLMPIKKPQVAQIKNLSPTIAIGQKAFSNNPRSTVGTITGIYDYIKSLYANYGDPYCPECGRKMKKNTPQKVIEQLKSMQKGTMVSIVARWPKKKKIAERIKAIENLGYARVRINKKNYKLKEIELDKSKWPDQTDICVVVDRIILDDKRFDRERIIDSMQTALKISEDHSKVIVDNEKEIAFNQKYFCPDGCCSLGNLKIKNFSFNSPEGACSFCKGMGKIVRADINKIIPNKKLSLAEGAIAPWLKTSGRQDKENYYEAVLRALAKRYNFSLRTPVHKLSKKVLDILMYGAGKDEIELKINNKPELLMFEGISKIIEDKYYNAKTNFFKNELEKYMTIEQCPNCQGKRLKSQFLNVKLFEQTIDQLVAMEISQLADLIDSRISVFEKDKKTEKQNQQLNIFKEVLARINSLKEAGVGYLNLDRTCQSLSGGEFQKIRLANQLNSGLSGILYILDEPTIGMHSRDNKKLINTLNKIKKAGNSVIVIEHDRELIQAADHIIEIGPFAGNEGGNLVFQGAYDKLLKNEKVETASYLKKKGGIYEEIINASKRNNYSEKLTIKGAAENNLKNIDVDIPLERLVAVAGVSGSGKSSLINNILVKELKRKFYNSKKSSGKHRKIINANKISKIINVDQGPLGKSSRSNPATYTGIFSEVRNLFAQTKAAKEKNLNASHFSFNMKGGRCEYCQGEGVRKMKMSFLEDVYSICPYCKGSRYNKKIMKVRHHGMNIAEVLDMNIDYAYYFFSSNEKIKSKLKTLRQVGLGYLKLGQSSAKLSGGEAQRIKLASELARNNRQKALYVLDEPSIGLHFRDIFKLLKVLRKLADKGNSVIVIEHNLDIIEASDWILELGPEGGGQGGELVFEGTFDKLKKSKTWTAKMLN